MGKFCATMRRAVVAGSIVLGGAVIAPASPAHAAFNDCATGAYGSGGNWCIWSGFNYTGTRNFYAASACTVNCSSNGLAAKSAGNRVSDRNFRLYRTNWTTIISMPPFTGNSFGGSEIVMIGAIY